MLASDAVGAGSLPVRDRLDQPEMMTVGDDQDLARLGQLGVLEDERARAGERQREDAVERALEQRAVRHLEQTGVEQLVEGDVALERLVVGQVHERLDRFVDRAQRAKVRGRRAPLGGEPRGRALEDAAQFDRVPDVGPGELAHHVAAAGKHAQQAFVLERGQRQAQRGARHSDPLDQAELGHPLAGLELTGQDLLAQAEQRAGHLGLAGRVDHRRRRVYSAAALLYAEVR